MLALGFLLVLGAQRGRPAAGLALARQHVHRRQLRLGAAGCARRRRRQRRPRGDLRNERRRHVHAARRAAHRPPPGRWRPGPRCPGSSTSRSTGSRCPCSGGRCGTGTRATMARWVAEGTHALAEWETDLSSQTGASQAGILLGSNDDIPAFRWVDKETGLLTACSAPADCARIERERATGIGLLVERRLEPRQPPLGRGRGGHPHRQPHRGREDAPTPATARSSPTASTSRGRSSSSAGRSSSSGRRRCARSGATSSRAAIEAASIRSSAPRCASSSAT